MDVDRPLKQRYKVMEDMKSEITDRTKVQMLLVGLLGEITKLFDCLLN